MWIIPAVSLALNRRLLAANPFGVIDGCAANVRKATIGSLDSWTFSRYFEMGLIGMAITSPAKGCLEVNNEICRILGYQRNELLTKTWDELTHPEDRPADVAQFNSVMDRDF